MLFAVVAYITDNLNIFGFWSVRQTKQPVLLFSKLLYIKKNANEWLTENNYSCNHTIFTNLFSFVAKSIVSEQHTGGDGVEGRSLFTFLVIVTRINSLKLVSSCI